MFNLLGKPSLLKGIHRTSSLDIKCAKLQKEKKKKKFESLKHKNVNQENYNC